MVLRTLRAAVLAATLALVLPGAAHAFSFPLVGWWPMNEGSGQSVRDWSGKGNHGVLGTSTAVEDTDPAWTSGVFNGSGLRFDGVDDRITIGDKPSLEPKRLTVAAWVRNEWSSGTYKYIVAKNALDCQHSSYGLYTGPEAGMAFYIADGTTKYESPLADPAAIWDGKWHHVAGTFDGRKVRLYVDGKEIGDGTPAPTQIDYNYPVQNGLIGSYGGDCGGSNLTLVSDVDGVQIWSEALPVDTIWSILKPIVSLAR